MQKKLIPKSKKCRMVGLKFTKHGKIFDRVWNLKNMLKFYKNRK